MPIQDIYLNPLNPQATSFMGFRTTPTAPFAHDIYSYLIESLRSCDRDGGDELILRWLVSEQAVFEETQARIRSLVDLFDPKRAPLAALDFVRWIVGFSRRLDFVVTDLSEDELRRLITIAVRMWKKRGTEAGIIETLEALTTRTARIVNWFDFRLISDEVEIGREDLGFDPWLISQPGVSPSVVPLSVSAYPDPGDPAAATALTFDVSNLFSPDDGEGAEVRILYVPTGVVQVRTVQVGNIVVSDDLMGQAAPPSTLESDYRVNVDPDEYVSDIRIVDDGTGTLNRSFVENIVRVMRPALERYWVRYLDFQDLMIEPTPLWEVIEGTASFEPESARIVLEDGSLRSTIVTNETNQATWTEYQASAQITLRDASGEGEFRFYFFDDDNFYAYVVDPATPEVRIDKVVGGVRSTIANYSLSSFHTGVRYFLRVATSNTGMGHQISVFLDADLLGIVVDSDHSEGAIALSVVTGQQLIVHFAEVFQFPLNSTRIGPEP